MHPGASAMSQPQERQPVEVAGCQEEPQRPNRPAEGGADGDDQELRSQPERSGGGGGRSGGGFGGGGRRW